VKESSGHQPGHQRGVFDRVPSPVSAPRENLIGPPAAEHDAESEKGPGDDCGPVASAQPFRSGNLEGEGAYRIREGNGETHVSDVEKWWVDRHHEMILKKRIRSGAVEWGIDRGERPGTRGETPILGRLDTHLEWVGDGEHQAEEEDAHATDHRKGPRPQFAGRTAVASGYCPCEHGEDQTPKEDRALQRRPCRRDIKREGCCRCVVVGDVGKGEVVGQEGDLHGAHRHHRPHEHQVGRANQIGSRVRS